MRDMTVTEGNNATFRCEPMSLPEELPPTQPLWKKNGVNLEFDEGRIESKNRKEDKKIMMPFINIYTILILSMYTINIVYIESPFLLPKMLQLLFQSVQISTIPSCKIFSVVGYL